MVTSQTTIAMRHLLIFSLLAFSACNYSDKKTVTEEPAVIENKVKEKENCYAWYSNRDTIQMTIMVNGNQANGKLIYDFFEKDGSTGTFKGAFKGDTLYADYEFTSEGTTSVRQVAFLQKRSSMVEGYGDMQEQAGRMIFTPQATLQFGATVLGKIPCRQ